jgi:hypothetical protein
MQCVVETGKPILVANVKNNEEPTSAQSIPNIRTLGLSSNAETLMMPDLMVPDTRALAAHVSQP